jgi:hypothetical protein
MSDVVLDVPSTESGAPGIKRGLECDAIEEVLSLRLGPKAEEESDICVYTTPPEELQEGGDHCNCCRPPECRSSCEMQI